MVVCATWHRGQCKVLQFKQIERDSTRVAPRAGWKRDLLSTMRLVSCAAILCAVALLFAGRGHAQERGQRGRRVQQSQQQQSTGQQQLGQRGRNEANEATTGLSLQQRQMGPYMGLCGRCNNNDRCINTDLTCHIRDGNLANVPPPGCSRTGRIAGQNYCITSLEAGAQCYPSGGDLCQPGLACLAGARPSHATSLTLQNLIVHDCDDIVPRYFPHSAER